MTMRLSMTMWSTATRITTRMRSNLGLMYMRRSAFTPIGTGNMRRELDLLVRHSSNGSSSSNQRPDPVREAMEPFETERNSRFIRLSWYALLALGSSGIALYLFFVYEQQLLEQRRRENTDQTVGRPKIGGPWVLVDHNGVVRTSLDFLGKYVLIYFGYTFCPDVCPEELEKLSKVLTTLKKEDGIGGETIVPLFVSCDPKRDSLDSIREYLSEYHNDFLGLTGTHEQIKRIAKVFKMYYSAPPRAVDDDEVDYLVDHSIFSYLMGPDGKYVSHFGINDTAEDVVAKIRDDIKNLRGVIRREEDM